MDTALARLGAACLEHALENPQAQHDKDSPLFALFRSLSQGHSTPASIEGPDDVTDPRPNASEISQLPATSAMTHVSKADTKTYVARSLVNRNLTFTESDLFRNDQISLFRDQYLCWRHICAEDDDHDSVLDRIVATAKRLDMLKDQEIGSIPLEMTYFYLFSHYKQYKLHNNVASLTNGGLYDSILHRLYAEEWDHLSDRARLRLRDKLRRRLVIGRRWSLAVDRLSRGVILLTGKKISTLIHQKSFGLTDLNTLFTHITEQYVQALELYNKADFLGGKLPTSGIIYLSGALSECSEIESLLCQGQKLIQN